ncbi:hypothetical protein ACNDRN_004841, partial [Escherichia coli]
LHQALCTDSRMRRKRLIRPTSNTACGRCCAFCGRLFSARPETPFPPVFQSIDYSHKKYWHAFCQ